MGIHHEMGDRFERAGEERIRLTAHHAGVFARASMLLFATTVSAMAQGKAAGQAYDVDPATSQAVIDVGKAGALSFLGGHTHEVRGPIRGRVFVDAGHLESSTLELDIPAASLQVTGKGEPAGDVPKVQEKMAGEEVLDVARYPTIAFRSTALAVRASREAVTDVVVTGELTLHGVTRSLSVPAQVELGTNRIAARGAFSIKQSDYGIEPVTVAGVVSVRDALDVRFTIAAAAREQP